jgi:hypothetical protein
MLLKTHYPTRFCLLKKSTINFDALSPNLFLDFSQQVRFLSQFSMNLPKKLKMPLLCGFGMKPQGILRKPNVRGSFGSESSFQNCFWNVFSTSGLSKICKIRNVRKLPSPFSRNTLIPCSEKSSWSLKTSFWKKNCTTNSKMAMKIFQLFPSFHSSIGSPKTMNLRDLQESFVGEIFHYRF